MSDIRQMLLEESRKLQEISERNQQLFDRMLPSDQEHFSSKSEALNAGSRHETDDGFGSSRPLDSLDRNVFDAPRSATKLAPATPHNPDTGDLTEAQLQTPHVFHPEVPRIPFENIAERAMPVDTKAELKVNAYLQSFDGADRLLVGVHMKLLHSYYKSHAEGLEPEDFVRLCRAAGLMDGEHAFTNPDIISITSGVIEEMQVSNPDRAVDTSMDFLSFCIAAGEVAAFRFSKAASRHVANRLLFRRVLAPLSFHVMLSDLVPQSVVNLVPQTSADSTPAAATSFGRSSRGIGNESNLGATMPGVVGGQTGLLDPLIGLAPGPLEQSRSQVELESAIQRRAQIPVGSLLSPTPGHVQSHRFAQDNQASQFSITALQSSPLRNEQIAEVGSEDGSDEESRNGGNIQGIAGTLKEFSPTTSTLKGKHPAPALVALLSFSKEYLLECFDRYAVASRERNPNACEEDLEGYMNQMHFQAFAFDSALGQQLSVPDMCRIFVNHCSSKTLTDGNLVDGLSFTQFVSCLTEIADSVYVHLHGCDKYDAMLMVFYWLDMHNGLFHGQARLLLSQRFPLHNAAHCFTSLKVWNMFDFYCSFGNRGNHGLNAQISSVKCLKLMREHGLIGEEGASDQSGSSKKRRKKKGRNLVSVTRADIIFQKVITAEQKRKQLEEAEMARTSSKRRSGGDGLVKDYFQGATASRTNRPARVSFSRKLEFRGFCIFLVEIGIFLYPDLHPEDAYQKLLHTFFFNDSVASHNQQVNNDAVADLEQQLQPSNSMNAAAITAAAPGDSGDGQLIAVIDQFQSLQRLTVLKHVLSRLHDNRLRVALRRWRDTQQHSSSESSINILQDEIAALHSKLAKAKREVGLWKRKCLLAEDD